MWGLGPPDPSGFAGAGGELDQHVRFSVGGGCALGNSRGMARVLRGVDAEPDALFRLGGLELETGLDMTV